MLMMVVVMEINIMEMVVMMVMPLYDSSHI
jgi:hypothetical protein